MEDAEANKVRKRKQRAVLSCRDCRRRKLKCDRELPCNRCIQGGAAEKCTYSNGESSAGQSTQRANSLPKPARIRRVSPALPPQNISEHEPASSVRSEEHVKQDRIREVERRLASVEALLASSGKGSGDPPDATSKLTEPAKLRDAQSTSNVLFKGRGFRTFCYGPTCSMMVISHFPDLRPFMKRLYTGSTLERLKDDGKIQEDRSHQIQVPKDSTSVLFIPSIRSLLPDRETVDKVVRTYLATFETTYRILHIPTFVAAYQTFWDAPSPPNSDLDAIVLAILACTLCISSHENTRYDSTGSTFRSKAVVWIKACEAWLKRQSNKHRSLATLQVRCLRLLALSTTCYKTKEYYQEVVNHLNVMRSFGMHRDPSILGTRCSVFESEMRRRLWATSMELELQASIDKGTSSTLSSLEFDCAPPSQFMDFELYPDMDAENMPTPAPDSVYTDTSYLYHSSKSIALRIRLCALANSLHTNPTSEDILRDERSVLTALAQIPKWTEAHTFQASTLVDLQLRQFIVILHIHRALQLKQNPECRYSIFTALEASAATVERHTKLIDADNHALCCTRSDYVRAALLICHVAYHASLAADALVVRVSKTIFDDTMEKAFRLLEQRSLRPGRGNHQFWYLSAACSLVGIRFEPHRAQILERQATDRLCKVLYKILSLQDELSQMSGADEVILGDGSSNAPTLIHMPATAPQNAPFQAADPVLGDAAFPMLDGLGSDGASAWLLDDFWFLDDLPLV